MPRWTRGQWLLRVVIVLAPQLAVLASVPAGATLRAWFLVLLLALSVTFALFPASLSGVGVLMLPLAWWVAVPDDRMHPMSLVAAVALLACHVAGLLAAQGPDRLPLDPGLARRWAVRSLLAAAAAPAVWLVAEALAEQPAPPGIWVAGLAAAALGAVVTARLFGAAPTGTDALAEARLDVTNG